MRFYLKLAWRNTFRNKRRTIIASIAMGIGLACLIFYDAILIGMERSFVLSATDTYLGQAQIHRRGFRETMQVDDTILELDKVTSGLAENKTVEAFTVRALSLAMVTSPSDAASVLLVGADPDTEKRISRVDRAIREGGFFRTGDERDIVIGSELAETLAVALGDRVVITASQAGTGDLAQDMFLVSGIYHFNAKELDSGMAFIRLSKARQLLGIGHGAHEIALKFKSLEMSENKSLPFWKEYSRFGNEAVSWVDLLPQLKAVFDLTGIIRLVMAGLLIGVVVFGVINTLFMSLYERLFEFGVLRAVGTRPGGIRKLVVFEAGGLGILSSGVGILLGLLAQLAVGHTGIDYRGIEFAGATIQNVIYPVIRLYQYVIYPIGLCVFTLLIGFYPARVAAKMPITEAMRRSF
jgi:ABC-type lipoprotein release transport system permease subunit